MILTDDDDWIPLWRFYENGVTTQVNVTIIVTTTNHLVHNTSTSSNLFPRSAQLPTR